MLKVDLHIIILWNGQRQSCYEQLHLSSVLANYFCAVKCSVRFFFKGIPFQIRCLHVAALIPKFRDWVLSPVCLAVFCILCFAYTDGLYSLVQPVVIIYYFLSKGKRQKCILKLYCLKIWSKVDLYFEFQWDLKVAKGWFIRAPPLLESVTYTHNWCTQNPILALQCWHSVQLACQSYVYDVTELKPTKMRRYKTLLICFLRTQFCFLIPIWGLLAL